MNHLSRKMSFIAALMFAGIFCVAQAHARPPTVLNSPGYDRALKESRANYLRAAGSEPAPVAPAKKKAKPKSKN